MRGRRRERVAGRLALVVGPYVVILVAGALATQVWRWLGVLLAGRLSPTGAIFVWSRMVATAIIAALAGQLILQPQGALQVVPIWLRIVSLGFGLVVLWRFRSRGAALTLGLFAALVVMAAGYIAFGPA